MYDTKEARIQASFIALHTADNAKSTGGTVFPNIDEKSSHRSQSCGVSSFSF